MSISINNMTNTKIISVVAASHGYHVEPQVDSLIERGIYGQTNHKLKTLWFSDFYVGAHELVHVLQTSADLIWFALSDYDGYADPSLHGGSGHSVREWQAHSIEGFLKDLDWKCRLQREQADKPSWYEVPAELAYCQYPIISSEEWLTTFLLLVEMGNTSKLKSWLTTYGFIFEA